MRVLSSRLLSCVVTPSIHITKPSRPRVTQGGRLVTSHTATPAAVCTQRNMSSLEDLKFDNRVLKSLPIDPDPDNYVRGVAGGYLLV